jgi:hypothetical protein
MFIRQAVGRRSYCSLLATLTLVFNDGSKKLLDIKEGSVIKDLVYTDTTTKTDKTVSGKVKVINFISMESYAEAINSSCIEKSKSIFSKKVSIDSILIDCSSEYTTNMIQIPIKNIKDFKADRYIDEIYQGETHIVNEETTLTEAYEEAEAGDTILIAAGTYDTELTIDKPIRITAKKDDEGNYEEVIFNKGLTIDCSSGVVEIDHVTFKDISSPSGTGSSRNAAKGYGVTIISGECNLHDNQFINFNNYYSNIIINTESPVTIKDNVFDEGSSYHVIEWGTKTPVASGTVITGNTFGNIATHNVISLYSYEDNAEITITDNYFAYSANAIRLSNTNNATASINISNNVYKETDSIIEYAGLLIIQAYTEGQDFTKLTITFKNNRYEPNDKESYVLTEQNNGTIQAYYVFFDNSSWATSEPIVIF